MAQVWYEPDAVAVSIMRRVCDTGMLFLQVKVPLSQLSQEELPGALNLPGRQGLHAELPAAENESVLQFTHVSMLLDPSTVENVPEGHRSHLDIPSEEAYAPLEQLVQEAAPEPENFPTAQGTHVLELLEPTAPEKYPGAQRSQAP